MPGPTTKNRRRIVLKRRAKAKLPMSAADNGLKVTRDYQMNPLSPRRGFQLPGFGFSKQSTRNTFAKRSGR